MNGIAKRMMKGVRKVINESSSNLKFHKENAEEGMTKPTQEALSGIQELPPLLKQYSLILFYFIYFIVEFFFS